MARCLMALLLASLLAGCDTSRAAPADAANMDSFTGADSARPDINGLDINGLDITRPDLSPSCIAALKKLKQAMYATVPGAYTVVVRMDYQTLAFKGFQVIKSKYSKPVTLAQARATAQQDTGFGAKAKVVSPTKPEDLFVFYESPGDFGGAAAVSADTGKTVFGGGIVWMGLGKISVPQSWRPASELGVGCHSSTDPTLHPSQIRGYDLRGGGALPAAEVKKALAPIWKTAIPGANFNKGDLFHAVVLLYPPTVGAFNPKVADYVVLINGGWLE